MSIPPDVRNYYGGDRPLRGRLTPNSWTRPSECSVIGDADLYDIDAYYDDDGKRVNLWGDDIGPTWVLERGKNGKLRKYLDPTDPAGDDWWRNARRKLRERWQQIGGAR